MARSLYLRIKPVGLTHKVRQVFFIQKAAQARQTDGNGADAGALAEHLQPGLMCRKVFFCLRKRGLCGGKVSCLGLLFYRLGAAAKGLCHRREYASQQALNPSAAAKISKAAMVRRISGASFRFFSLRIFCYKLRFSGVVAQKKKHIT